MMQATRNRTGHDTQVRWNAVPMGLQRYGQLGERLWDPWSQGHMGSASIVMPDPLVQKP